MAYDINADRGESVIASAVVFIILCSFFVAMRFISHRTMRRAIFLDDWLIIPAWVMMMGLCANLICSVHLGDVGRHEDWVLLHHPEGLAYWSQTLFSMEILYLCILATEKTSILLFYLRIFQIQRWLRWVVYGLITYLWSWWFGVLIAVIFQCHPIAYLWDTSLDGSCFDRLAFYRWLSVPDLAHDVALLVIPTPMIWRLQMPKKQKVALCGVFVVGSLGCVASAIRLYYFFKLNAFSDDTWASVELMSWTCAEPGVILISACMPSLWPLLRRTVNLMSNKYGSAASSAVNAQTLHRRTGPKSSGTPMPHGDDNFILLHDLESDGNQAQSHVLVVANGDDAMRLDRTRGISVRREFTWDVAQEGSPGHYGPSQQRD